MLTLSSIALWIGLAGVPLDPAAWVERPLPDASWDGYVTFTLEHVVRVSRRLETDWHDGLHYRELDGRPLTFVPRDEALRPSRLALEWHGDECFLG